MAEPLPRSPSSLVTAISSPRSPLCTSPWPLLPPPLAVDRRPPESRAPATRHRQVPLPSTQQPEEEDAFVHRPISNEHSRSFVDRRSTKSRRRPSQHFSTQSLCATSSVIATSAGQNSSQHLLRSSPWVYPKLVHYFLSPQKLLI